MVRFVRTTGDAQNRKGDTMFPDHDFFDYQADVFDRLADALADDDQGRGRLADSARLLRRRALVAELADLLAAGTIGRAEAEDALRQCDADNAEGS